MLALFSFLSPICVLTRFCNFSSMLNITDGTDKDFNAVEATKFGLLLKLLEGEDSASVSTKNPILPDLNENIHFGNSLVNPSDVKEIKSLPDINPFDFDKEKYDVVVGNPPYMMSEDMKKFTPLELPIYKTKFLSAHKQFDKYFLFIEQGLNLLKQGGILGYIVPSKFTKVGAGKNLREELASKGYIHSIVSFGANQIFADKTTYTSLLILSKIKQEQFSYTEVKNLAEWKIRDFNHIITDVLPISTLSNELWFLIPPNLKGPYNAIVCQSENLEIIVGKNNINNGIQTSANEVYVIKPSKEDNVYIYFENEGVPNKIEKKIVKPYYETIRKKGEDKLNTYRTLTPNTVVIYPYHIVGGNVEFIKFKELKAKYPFAYKYLLAHNALDRQKDNPQRIFESLNSTGLELSQADLIRNYILMGLSRTNQDKIYKSYWEVIERNAKDETLNKSRVSDFIRDYLTLKNKEIPNKGDVYVKFKEQHPTTTIDQLEIILTELKSLVKYYNKLINPKNESDKEIRTQLEYINRLEINVAFPNNEPDLVFSNPKKQMYQLPSAKKRKSNLYFGSHIKD